MKTHKWSDIKKQHFTEERIEALRREALAELLEMDLKELRKFAHKTQAELAKAAKISQAELSRTEGREDHLLSTLRRYVEALGGELEVTATFGNKRIRLRGV
jgi:transcriptional regulator with XRE-family HTH domain